MAKLVFFPLGNADSTLINLNDGRILLKDYFNPEHSDEDKRIRLDEELIKFLNEHDQDSFDMVAFSHADDDHVHGAENFFWLEHAEKYQEEGRPRIHELAVPASFILETGLSGSARIIRQEARHRLIKMGEAVRVFGYPEQLQEWISDQGVDPSTRKHLITIAGECLPGFSQEAGQLEIFAHSPFSFRIEGEPENRNSNALVWHLTFFEDGNKISCILGADAEHQAWADIVYITKKQGNLEKLDWDLFRVSHHCSYTALSDEKGEQETTPRSEVSALFDRGSEGSILIASSNPIPTEDTDLPPHMQAAAYYRNIANHFGNEENFVVTMEWPSGDQPKPIEVETSVNGLTLVKDVSRIGGVASVLRGPSERVG